MESSVLEQSPTSPIISTLPPLSESFVSMVPESDNQTNSDPLPAPSSPTRSTLSPNAELPLNEGNISLDDILGNYIGLDNTNALLSIQDPS